MRSVSHSSITHNPSDRRERRVAKRQPASRPRRRLLIGGAFLLGAVVGLVLLAIPLLGVPGDAQAAKRGLSEAVAALRDGDVPTARDAVAEARAQVDSAQASAQGLGGDVWSKIPVLGTPVSDVRYLVQVLDDATATAEIGVDLYPSVAGRRATLFRDQQVDRTTLDQVILGTREVAAHLASAEQALGEVRASTPVVGDRIASLRDQAAAEVEPLAQAVTQIEPMLDSLPAVLGFEGRRRYLIAMLNPAELRYSGGAALSFAPMRWQEGKLDLGRTFGIVDDIRLRGVLTWPAVEGNDFHRRNTRLANATFAPSWSVSGEELLRAWHSATQERYDGVIALDVVTLSGLLAATGPVDVEGVGQVTAGNVVETLVGSYDDYYPDPSVQDEKNAAIASALQGQLFSGGKYVAKARALKTAASGRHLAIYFRDAGPQAAFAALDMSGDLTSPSGDYLGVFTQNRSGSKVDYWQRRSIGLDVVLAEDGTATNELDVLIDNDTPPFVAPVPDPGRGYFTRWSRLAAAAFLPDDARVKRFSVQRQPWMGEVGEFYDHSYVSQWAEIAPGKSARLKASYSVPGAAEVGTAGTLTYRLTIDPQGTVFPASAEVRVQVPDGYQVSRLPNGWTSEGDVVSFSTQALETTQEWEIVLRPGQEEDL